MNIQSTFKIVVFVLTLVAITSVADAQKLSYKSDKKSKVSSFTEPYRSIEVSAAEMGTLSQLDVREGDHVNKGDLLARLNDEVLQASLNMASKSMDARGKLNSAMAELNMQQGRFQKLLGLYQRNHASQIEIDRAKSQVAVAQAQVEAANDEITLKTLERERIKAQLEQRLLRSPIPGIVTRVFKDEGEFVSATDPVVANVVQLDPLLVVFSVPQQTALQIRSGQQVKLTIGEEDNDEAAETVGMVEFVSPNADAQSGTCRVKVKVDNPELRWPSGVACHLSTKDFENEAPATAKSKSKFRSLPVAKK